MQKVWDRIEAWLAREAPRVLRQLRPGASEAALRSLEKQIGAGLPAGVRKSYLIHDGAKGMDLLGYWQFMSVKQIIAAWRDLKTQYDKGYFKESGGPGCTDLAGVAATSGPIRPQWWNRKWIPFAVSEGHYFCFDLDPAKGGRAGQVLMWDRSMGERALLAPSFEKWWEQFAADLERGRRAPDEDGVLVET